MKKIYTLAITSAIALSLAGCAGGSSSLSPADAAKLDPNKVCSVKDNGIETVIANAKAYNAAAKKAGLEFRRLGVNNSALIAAVEEAMKTGAKEVQPMTVKKKKFKPAIETNYAAERACKFGLAPLRQAHDAESSYRLAIPGDGFKY